METCALSSSAEPTAGSTADRSRSPAGSATTGIRLSPPRRSAKREEEIGLDPSNVAVLEALPVVDTITTGFRIHPFLARVSPPPAWRPAPREVAQIMEMTVEGFLDPSVHGEEMWSFPEWPEPRNVRFFRVGEHKLWGATYRILRPLLPRMVSGEWEF